MTRTLQLNNAVSLYDKFSLVIPPDLKHYTDGPIGRRVIFIMDEKEDMVVSFEEDMKCLDMLDCIRKDSRAIVSEYRTEDGYLHQVKNLFKDDKKLRDIVYFHMEVPDENGDTRICPGQVMIHPVLRQLDGAEPVLIELLKGLTVRTEKGGG